MDNEHTKATVSPNMGAESLGAGGRSCVQHLTNRIGLCKQLNMVEAVCVRVMWGTHGKFSHLPLK